MPIVPASVRSLDGDDLDAIADVSARAFDPIFGEAWSAGQYLSTFALPGFQFRGIFHPVGDRLAGFAISRCILDESELLLLAILPESRGNGLGRQLIDDWLALGLTKSVGRYFLEVRRDNPALKLYTSAGFVACGVRPNYYRGGDGKVRDAITMERTEH